MAVIAGVPGVLMLEAAGVRGLWALALSPVVGFSFIAILGQAYALAGVASTPVTVLLPVVLVPIALVVILRNRVKPLRLPMLSPVALGVSLVLGLILGYSLFLSRIGSADTVFQAYDVTQHLNLIQAMRDSGRLTSLSVSPYLSAADAAIAPADYSGFYPAAWHAFCAVTGMILQVSTPLLINASMFYFCFLVFPSGMAAFLAAVFPDAKTIAVAGALATLAFVSFPWELLTFGPVYPNIAGFCLMPSVLAVFVRFLADGESVWSRVRTGCLVLLAVVGAVLCHPNVVFTCIVLMAPYCVSRILAACDGKSHQLVKKIGFSIAFVALCLGFWLFCYHLPMFEGTVTHYWPPYAWLFQELVNILTVSYHNGFNSEIAAQIPLGVLVVAGAVVALRRRGKRWLVVSYALACYILLIGASHDDELRCMTAGFWYSDPMRLSAVAAIAAIPLAALGLEWASRFAQRVVASYFRKLQDLVRVAIVVPVVAVAFLVVNYLPEFNLAGLHYEYSASEVNEINSQGLDYRSWPKSVHTTYGDYRRKISEVYSSNEPLDQTEKVFIQKALEIIPDGSLVVNNPMDGSFLAYGIYDMHMYYRNFVGFGGDNETSESKAIRLHLSELATNAEVQEAVEKVDAKYVIVLRGREDEASFIDLRDDYDPSLFCGITSITEETPGFSLVLKTGFMELYEIER